MKPVNLEGTRFGRLVAVKKMFVKGKHAYLCDCDCGKQSTPTYFNLKNGNTTSCGCIRSEACRLREKAKGHPTYGKVLSYYKRNAKVRGLAWNLTVEAFSSMISGNCFYCGEPPKPRVLVGQEISFNGIDRLDNDQGYTEENCVTCCVTCNRAKLTMTLEEFTTWIHKVHRFMTERSQ